MEYPIIRLMLFTAIASVVVSTSTLEAQPRVRGSSVSVNSGQRNYHHLRPVIAPRERAARQLVRTMERSVVRGRHPGLAVVGGPRIHLHEVTPANSVRGRPREFRVTTTSPHVDLKLLVPALVRAGEFEVMIHHADGRTEPRRALHYGLVGTYELPLRLSRGETTIRVRTFASDLPVETVVLYWDGPSRID